MRPRPLAVLVLLCLMAIPNRMAGCLLADAPNSRAIEARKSTEIRGRNRIGAPSCPDACPGVIRLAGRPGRSHPASTRTIVRTHLDSNASRSPSRSHPSPIILRLRC